MKKLRISDIKPGHIIGRSFKKPDLSELDRELNNAVVVVTGAGGSIGSELCRQLQEMSIKKLILVDNSEYNLYAIYEELKEKEIEVELIPALINVCNKIPLMRLFEKYNPSFVYHAAAYKHVNLVQVNPLEGILNNVQSTKNILEVSAKYKVKKFVLISTDKAVRPTNTMGASKRMCELLTSEFAKDTGLCFSSVRFGNVAGSSGSLIPKLKKLISEGKPLTITDARMTRFFMLIPEAVNLVLKASENAKPSDVTLLNMGSPINIMEIVNKLLMLSGRHPNDYPIKFTGAMPGEKIKEELFVDKGIFFEKDQLFIRLPDGDKGFNKVNFKDISYNSIKTVADYLIKMAHEYQTEALELLWSAVSQNFDSEDQADIDNYKEISKQAA